MGRLQQSVVEAFFFTVFGLPSNYGLPTELSTLSTTQVCGVCMHEAVKEGKKATSQARDRSSKTSTSTR